MNQQLNRTELIQLVQRIKACDGTEAEVDEMISALAANIIHPVGTNLIFRPKRKMTAEELVDEALSHTPIQLPHKPRPCSVSQSAIGCG